MSSPALTSEAQLRYILQWFGEFSELQREDFLPILAAARGDHQDQLAATLAGISCQDKPVSLFQCRIKLFNEWYPTWAEEEQDRLVKGVSEIDSEFGSKLHEFLTNGLQLNGDYNGIDEVNISKDDKPNKEDEEPQGNPSEDIIVSEETEDQVQHDNIPLEIAAAS